MIALNDDFGCCFARPDPVVLPLFFVVLMTPLFLHIDPKASLMEQAYQTAQLSDTLVIASRNAMIDANAAAKLNFTRQPETFAQFKARLSKEAGGDALYKKIIEASKKQTQELGCFVAGTLVHTKDGLRPIEQIKVGDYVLSKPESGVGEVSYKRVSRTFEYDDKEVYFVTYGFHSPGSTSGRQQFEMLVVTGAHPLWVSRYIDEDTQEVQEVNDWVSVRALYDQSYSGWAENPGKSPLKVELELSDGRIAELDYRLPILQTGDPDTGLAFDDDGSWGGGDWEGVAVNFGGGAPSLGFNESGSYKTMHLQLDPIEYHGFDHSTTVYRSYGFMPLLKKVYNIEVEDNHTYYVGAAGLLVHNSSGLEVAYAETNPAKALRVYDGSEQKWKKTLTADFKANGDKGIAIAPDIESTSPAGSVQAIFDGSISQLNVQNGRLAAYTVAYKNSLGGENHIIIGDALAYIYQNGKRIASNFFIDVKSGDLGSWGLGGDLGSGLAKQHQIKLTFTSGKTLKNRIPRRAVSPHLAGRQA